jgi:two-component system nitrate/nitrite response regulator NarL
MTTVLVVDDHPLYREALGDAIRADDRFELVGEAADGPTAFSLILELAPDVAVLDIRMPGIDGPEVSRRLAGAGSVTRILFVSAYDDGSLVYGALAAGGDGFLAKDSSSATICDAIAKVARGESVLTSEAGTALIGQLHARRESESAPLLTAREQEALEHIAEGRSAVEIGQALHLSTATIKTHLHSLYGKLDVSDRAAAVAEGMRRGLIR